MARGERTEFISKHCVAGVGCRQFCAVKSEMLTIKTAAKLHNNFIVSATHLPKPCRGENANDQKASTCFSASFSRRFFSSSGHQLLGCQLTSRPGAYCEAH